MRIGLINQLHGRPGRQPPEPTWKSISSRAVASEAAGFDVFVFEDALLYRWDGGGTDGVWESVSIAGALAASTSSIRIGHSVINSPYRSPAMMASIATTLDEISDGRYTLGIGAGNTFDSDYRAFGFPTDRRYARFAEAIEILHSLLKRGRAHFNGVYYRVEDSELVLRGPSATGPPINIAAGGPRMLGLTARYADEWNWWGWDETYDETVARLEPLIEVLDLALEEEGRDPATLVRTFDLYGVVAPGLDAEHGLNKPIDGSAEQIADHILRFGALGVEEVRVDVWPKTVDAIEAMTKVVELVHEGK